MAIGNSNNTIKTRIQLKSDTEANWNKAGPKENSPGFIPLAGELIIYTPDNTHDYSRLKVGDGSTNVVFLPFIDAGTVNGNTIVNEIEYISGSLPASGNSTKLYVDTTNNAIYYYNGASWQKLSNYTYTISKGTATSITEWNAGYTPTFTLSGGTFSISSGQAPILYKTSVNVVTNVTKEGET